MPFELLAGIGSIIGGIGGIIGSRKTPKPEPVPTPRENILSQAKGVREASKKYGFNPLTMLQYGQTAGAMGSGGGGGGSGPPLASIDLITGGLKDINDVMSGDAARRRAADQLELDLAKVKIDQAKNQMALDHTRQLAAAPLGRRAITAPTLAGQTYGPPGHNPPGGRLTMSSRPPVHPFAREIDMTPVRDIHGVATRIPTQVAERLGVQPFGQLIMEDYEALYGDEGGQVVGLPKIPDTLVYHSTGDPARPVFTDDPYGDQRRERAKPPPLADEGASTADIYEKIFGAEHPATKKRRTKGQK